MIRGEAACIKRFLEQDNGEEDEDDFSPVEFIIQQAKIKQEKGASTGSSVLQKLKREGLFGNFNDAQKLQDSYFSAEPTSSSQTAQFKQG